MQADRRTPVIPYPADPTGSWSTQQIERIVSEVRRLASTRYDPVPISWYGDRAPLLHTLSLGETERPRVTSGMTRSADASIALGYQSECEELASQHPYCSVSLKGAVGGLETPLGLHTHAGSDTFYCDCGSGTALYTLLAQRMAYVELVSSVEEFIQCR